MGPNFSPLLQYYITYSKDKPRKTIADKNGKLTDDEHDYCMNVVFLPIPPAPVREKPAHHSHIGLDRRPNQTSA